MSRAAEGKAYRERRKEAMGAQAFKDSEALKRKTRRQRNRPAPAAPVAIAVEVKQPEQKQEEKVTGTLDTIFAAKQQFAEASGHTIKRSSVETALNRIKRLHKYINDTPMLD